MPKVVTFSLFLGLSISSCAFWASAWLHQQQSKAASIFRMNSSLSKLAPGASNALASQRLPWALIAACEGCSFRVCLPSRKCEHLSGYEPETPLSSLGGQHFLKKH